MTFSRVTLKGNSGLLLIDSMVEISRVIAGSFVLYLSSALCSSAGVGGGSLNVPILYSVFGFDYATAIVLSQCTLMGNYVLQVLINLDKRNPACAEKPLIYWDIILVLLPAELCGANLGSIIAAVLPETLLFILAMIVLLVAGTLSTKKAIFLYDKESKSLLISSCNNSDAGDMDHSGVGSLQEELLSAGRRRVYSAASVASSSNIDTPSMITVASIIPRYVYCCCDQNWFRKKEHHEQHPQQQINHDNHKLESPIIAHRSPRRLSISSGSEGQANPSFLQRPITETIITEAGTPIVIVSTPNTTNCNDVIRSFDSDPEAVHMAPAGAAAGQMHQSTTSLSSSAGAEAGVGEGISDLEYRRRRSMSAGNIHSKEVTVHSGAIYHQSNSSTVVAAPGESLSTVPGSMAAINPAGENHAGEFKIDLEPDLPPLQVPWPSVRAILLGWAIYIACYSAMKNFSTCSVPFVLLLLAIYAVLAVEVCWGLWYLMRLQRRHPHRVTEGDIVWMPSSAVLPLYAFGVGVLTSLLGIGGGELMGPLMLMLKVR